MEMIGTNIEELDTVLRTQTPPTPQPLIDWQLEAEHVVNAAEFAKRKNEIEKLRELDDEAKRLLNQREDLINNN